MRYLVKDSVKNLNKGEGAISIGLKREESLIAVDLVNICEKTHNVTGMQEFKLICNRGKNKFSDYDLVVLKEIYKYTSEIKIGYLSDKDILDVNMDKIDDVFDIKQYYEKFNDNKEFLYNRYLRNIDYVLKRGSPEMQNLVIKMLDPNFEVKSQENFNNIIDGIGKDNKYPEGLKKKSLISFIEYNHRYANQDIRESFGTTKVNFVKIDKSKTVDVEYNVKKPEVVSGNINLNKAINSIVKFVSKLIK